MQTPIRRLNISMMRLTSSMTMLAFQLISGYFWYDWWLIQVGQIYLWASIFQLAMSIFKLLKFNFQPFDMVGKLTLRRKVEIFDRLVRWLNLAVTRWIFNLMQRAPCKRPPCRSHSCSAVANGVSIGVLRQCCTKSLVTVNESDCHQSLAQF